MIPFQLADVIYQSKNKFSGVKKFYVQEIDSVKIVSDVDNAENNDNDSEASEQAPEVNDKVGVTTEHLLKHAYEAFDANMDYCRNKSSVDVQLIFRNEKSIIQRIALIPPFKLNVTKDQ